jgi:dihydrofolate reductase
MKVILVAAMTADGYIARHPNHLPTTWTTASDRQLFSRLAKEYDNILMGLNTFLATAQKYPTVFTKSLPQRRLLVLTHHPEAVTGYPKVEPTALSPQELVAKLEQEGAKGLLVCGGIGIYSEYMQSGLVTELYISIQPTLFGQGMTLFNSNLDVQLQLLDSHSHVDGTVVLHYAIVQ